MMIKGLIGKVKNIYYQSTNKGDESTSKVLEDEPFYVSENLINYSEKLVIHGKQYKKEELLKLLEMGY